MTTPTLSEMRGMVLAKRCEQTRVPIEEKMISDLVSRCKPSPLDYRAAKDRPKVWVGPVIYPTADPDPSGPQYNPVDPAQTQWDRFL